MSSNPDDGTNIQVVVRIRPNNDAEKKNKSPNVISALSDTEIRVQNTIKNSTIADKMFTYDKVFTATSTQEDIFSNTAEPLIDEVIAGYNATIMAYGQTSSGKTHTICGWDPTMSDFTTKQSDSLIDGQAGLIPRCVHALFTRLQRQGVEFSIKVSFLELYNEELTDLTSDDLTKQLRIYEDPKQGTLVQNLDETHVTSPNDVFMLLKKAHNRRHVAETSFNLQSSRSHYIFTIVCHIKDVQDNEELFRTGKLHLVDLAGSESFWNPKNDKEKRLIEAGKINQSLLALGRCITALVQKQISIPFRDSKLTRILKDSFTKSKTAIIATISPSITCADESVSTLDYAYRAKSIKNKPQINERITQKHYFRDLVAQISSLKQENAALRNKNGIYLPPEHYKQLTDGYDLKCQELLEATAEMNLKQLENVEKEATIQYTFEVLDVVGKEYSRSNHMLLRTRFGLEKAKKDLYLTQQALAEEEFYSTSISNVENALHDEGNMLIRTSQGLDGENDQLYAKILRQEIHEKANIGYINVYQSAALDTYDAMCQGLEDNNEKVNKAFEMEKNQLNMYATMTSTTASKLITSMNSFDTDMNSKITDMSAESCAKSGELDAENRSFEKLHIERVHKRNDDLAMMNSMMIATLNTQQNQLTDGHQQYLERTTGLIKQNEKATDEINSQFAQFTTEFVAQLDAEHARDAKATDSMLEHVKLAAIMDQAEYQARQADSTRLINHVANYQKIHQNQYNETVALDQTQFDGNCKWLDGIVKHEESNAALNTNGLIQHLADLTSQNAQVNVQFTAMHEHLDQYDQEYDTWSKTHQTAINNNHEVNLVKVSQLNDNSTAWFEQYNNELTELQCAQEEQFQTSQQANVKLQQTVTAFQQSMQNQLKSDTTSLLSTLTNLIQTFVATQEDKINQHSAQMMEMLSSHQLQHEHDYTMNKITYEKQIHQLHNKYSEDSLNAYQQFKNTTSDQFVKSVTHLQSIDQTHQVAMQSLRTNHLNPALSQIDHNCQSNTAFIQSQRQFLQDQSAQHQAAFSTHKQTLAQNHSSTQSLLENHHKTHSTSNYPITLSKLNNLQGLETEAFQKRQQSQQQFTNAITTNHQAALSHETAVETLFLHHKDDITLNINMVATQNTAELKKSMNTANTRTAELTTLNANLQSAANSNTQSLISSNTTDFTTPITNHCAQTRDKLHNLQSSIQSHSTTLSTSVQAHTSATTPIATQLDTNARGFANTFTTNLERVSQAQLQHNSNLSSSISSLTNTLTVLTTSEVQPYQPTGQTPMKKQWNYPVALSSSLPKNQILDQYRAQNMISEETAYDLQDDDVVVVGKFNLDGLIQDDDIHVQLTPSHHQLIERCTQYQATGANEGDNDKSEPVSVVEVEATDTIAQKELHAFSLLATLPTPNLPTFVHTEIIANAESDPADNTAKKTITVVIDPNPKIIKGRHDLLKSTLQSTKYVSEEKTNQILTTSRDFVPNHAATINTMIPGKMRLSETSTHSPPPEDDEVSLGEGTNVGDAVDTAAHEEVQAVSGFVHPMMQIDDDDEEEVEVVLNVKQLPNPLSSPQITQLEPLSIPPSPISSQSSTTPQPTPPQQPMQLPPPTPTGIKSTQPAETVSATTAPRPVAVAPKPRVATATSTTASASRQTPTAASTASSIAPKLTNPPSRLTKVGPNADNLQPTTVVKTSTTTSTIASSRGPTATTTAGRTPTTSSRINMGTTTARATGTQPSAVPRRQ